jgi:hypothetical protein
MSMSYQECLYRTLGEDGVFFRGLPGAPAVPVWPAKLARCEQEQAAQGGATRATLEPIIWIQCGQVAAPAPDGGYLCEHHMVGWYCENCGGELPDYGPGALCAQCVDQPPEESDYWFVFLDDDTDWRLYPDDSDTMDGGGESDVGGEPWDGEPEI